MQDIQRDDGTGLESILGLERPGIYHEDTVSIFLKLMEPQFDALAQLGPERELILAIGEYEFALTANEDQRFELLSTEFLSRLEYEDYFLISLYQNSDSANKLWEYGFVINGLHVYYQMPSHPLPEEIAQEKLVGAKVLVRTLGGMRLKYEYRAPYDQIIEDVTFTFDSPGWYCKERGVAHPTTGNNQCVSVTAGAQITVSPLPPVPPAALNPECNEQYCSIWWEPATSTGEVLWDDNMKVNASYHANTKDKITGAGKQSRISSFTVETRTLEPVVPPIGPMKGSDVRMLEDVLWHLGLSAQHKYINRSGNPEGMGKSGTRLGENSQTLGGIVGGVKDRSTYTIGMAGSNGAGSLERMIKRFQGRNDFVCSPCTDLVSGNKSDGKVDTVVLKDLSEAWDEYYNAYSPHKNKPVVNFNTTGINTWLTAAADLWETGGGTGSNVPATYTQAKHNSMLTAAGQANATTGTRVELLRAWKRQEASTHWGRGAPQTNYRIFEGGADEYGSIGFSQIIYSLRYGATGSRCDALKNYNLYDPAQAISGMIAFVSADNNANGNCKKSFFHAFHASGSWSAMQSGNSDLIGYKLAGQTTIQAMARNRVDDDYEKLMKAIAGYNGSDGTNSRTWANMLTRSHSTTKNGQHIMGKRYSNRTYAMQVMGRYGIPRRTYVWVGARDLHGQPLWCFAFGEEEWMAGGQWREYRKYAEDYQAGMPTPGTPDPRELCR